MSQLIIRLLVIPHLGRDLLSKKEWVGHRFIHSKNIRVPTIYKDLCCILQERGREREIYKVAALWSSIVYREGLISIRSSGTKPHT